ncbi:nucleoside diphosphate-linked moiety X motif 19 [Striga asiatica]|uniref:Nucleoside diphosphate-linked moiety X motif 19 n=1 Tax=Striga asiatica TaxID=4170 RepID=A0A5A7Q1R0_STRAF|nr:nucleoside diphosphate-linked moiety X motif 19 [Striga asiatica]
MLSIPYAFNQKENNALYSIQHFHLVVADVDFNVILEDDSVDGLLKGWGWMMCPPGREKRKIDSSTVVLYLKEVPRVFVSQSQLALQGGHPERGALAKSCRCDLFSCFRSGLRSQHVHRQPIRNWKRLPTWPLEDNSGSEGARSLDLSLSFLNQAQGEVSQAGVLLTVRVSRVSKQAKGDPKSCTYMEGRLKSAFYKGGRKQKHRNKRKLKYERFL